MASVLASITIFLAAAPLHQTLALLLERPCLARPCCMSCTAWFGETVLHELYDNITIDQLLKDGSMSTRKNPDFPDRTQYSMVATPADVDVPEGTEHQQSSLRGTAGVLAYPRESKAEEVMRQFIGSSADGSSESTVVGRKVGDFVGDRLGEVVSLVNKDMGKAAYDIVGPPVSKAVAGLVAKHGVSGVVGKAVGYPVGGMVGHFVGDRVGEVVSAVNEDMGKAVRSKVSDLVGYPVADVVAGFVADAMDKDVAETANKRSNPNPLDRTQDLIDVPLTAPLSEEGYQTVATLKDDEAMSTFVRRQLDTLGMHARSPEELHAWVGWFSGTRATQNYTAMVKELRTQELFVPNGI